MIATTLGPSDLLKASFSHVTACADLWFLKLTCKPVGTGFPIPREASANLVIQETRSEADTPITELKLLLTLKLKGDSLVAGILSIPTISVAPGTLDLLVHSSPRTS